MSVSEWGSGDTMNELEATMWRSGKHPENSTQGGVLQVFGATPEWEDVVRLHEVGLERFPRFTQRVLEPALPLGNPVWVNDEHFDLSYHLRRVRLPEPGSKRQLLDLAQGLAATALAPSRPLWTGTFVEGLEGGRSAYFLTVHHCLMDGFASIQLLSELQKLGAANGRSPRHDSPAHRSGGPLALTVRQGAGRLSGALGLVRGSAATAVRRVRLGPAKNLRFARSVVRVLAPPPPSGSELLAAGPRTTWRYGTLECGLDELKAAAKAAGGTLNDAYVSAILGGLRSYHESVGAPISDITVNIPVSVRRDDDPAGGNKFATAFISAPSSEPDPARRIVKLGATVRAIREEPALDFFSLLLPALNRAPAALITPLFVSMQNRADLTVSNVPGIQDEVRFLNARVEAMYYFGPLPGSSITTVLCSQTGRCFIGINCDGDVFEDPEALFGFCQTALDEVLALAPIKETT